MPNASLTGLTSEIGGKGIASQTNPTGPLDHSPHYPCPQTLTYKEVETDAPESDDSLPLLSN
jgi:hypothetical protein